MPVSTADFYAYAQATGTPVPQNKKEQAEGYKVTGRYS